MVMDLAKTAMWSTTMEDWETIHRCGGLEANQPGTPTLRLVQERLAQGNNLVYRAESPRRSYRMYTIHLMEPEETHMWFKEMGVRKENIRKASSIIKKTGSEARKSIPMERLWWTSGFRTHRWRLIQSGPPRKRSTPIERCLEIKGSRLKGYRRHPRERSMIQLLMRSNSTALLKERNLLCGQRELKAQWSSLILTTQSRGGSMPTWSVALVWARISWGRLPQLPELSPARIASLSTWSKLTEGRTSLESKRFSIRTPTCAKT